MSCHRTSFAYPAQHANRENGGGAGATRLVFPPRTRPALAAHARSLRDLDFGDHAPADAGQDGDSLLAAVDGALAWYRGTGRGSTGKRAQALGRTGLLRPCSQFAKGGAADHRTTRRCVPEKI